MHLAQCLATVRCLITSVLVCILVYLIYILVAFYGKAHGGILCDFCVNVYGCSETNISLQIFCFTFQNFEVIPLSG